MDFSFSDPIFSGVFLSFLRESRMHGEITLMLQHGEVTRATITQSVVVKDAEGRKIVHDVQLFSSVGGKKANGY